MAHIAGGKIAGSHTSVIDAAYPIVTSAQKLECVSKIVLGVIKPIRSPSAKLRLKIQPISAGLRVRVRGARSVQELFLLRQKGVTDESWRQAIVTFQKALDSIN